jgi:hypothetical protein
MKEVNKGSILFEAVIAVAVGVLFIVPLATLVTITSSGTGRVDQAQEALTNAIEGDEAIQTIDFDDIPITADGQLSFSSGQWQVTAGGGPESLSGGYTRSIQVLDVYRDGNCEIVQNGGTLDSDSKLVETSITWTDLEGNAQSVNNESLITRWDDPQGGCFVSEAASVVDLDISTSANWHGQKQLRDVFITNNGSSDVTITKVTMTWDNNELVEQLFIDTKIWSNSGPGTPSGSQVSGTELDVEDLTLVPSQIGNMSKVQFSDNMIGTTLTIKLEFSDGSSITSDPFMPGAGFAISGGTVSITQPTTVQLEVLGTAITYGEGGPDLPVTVDAFINQQIQSLFNGQAVQQNDTWQYAAQSGDDIYSMGTVHIPYIGANWTIGYDSTNQNQVVTAVNGDQPPAFDPFGGQPSIESFVEPILDEQTGTITIDDDQVVWFFELGSSDPNSSAYDLQDLVILLTIL